MEIAFKKVTKEGLNFLINEEKVHFFGEVCLKSRSIASCQGHIEGEILYSCDICGDDIRLILKEAVDILAYDGICKKKEIELNIIEFYDGFINFNEILNSELESIKSDYHYCDKCINL